MVTHLRGSGLGACAAMLLLLLVRSPEIQGQRPGSDDLSFDVAPVAVSVAWGHGVAPGTSLGLALGGGLPWAVALFPGDLSTPADDDSAPTAVGELAHVALFLRRTRAGGSVTVEGGPRVAWVYHGSSEYQSFFIGAYVSAFWRVGPLAAGPRVTLGRYREASGRDEMNLALVPLQVRLTLGLGGGLR